MSLKVEIRELMNDSLKTGNKPLKEIYASILNALLNKEKELKAELTDEQELSVIIKLSKRINESIETCPVDRVDTLESYYKERDVILKFLSNSGTQLNESEIKDSINDLINSLGISNPTPKERGLIMKNLMPAMKGKADGKLVSKILDSMLSI